MSPILGIWASSKFTQADTGAMDPLQVITVGAAGASSITFSNISQNYAHLQIRCFMNAISTVDSVYLRLNGDTGSNYSLHTLLGEGVAARAQALANSSTINVGGMWYGLQTNYPGVSIIDILDYTDTNKYTTVRALAGQDGNTTNTGSVGLLSGNWRNTNAVTSLTIYLSGGSGTWTNSSQFALYGVKGAA